MATFQENIANIRSVAVYGKDVRASIADGLEQANANAESVIASTIQSAKSALDESIDVVSGRVTTLGNRVSALDDRVSAVQQQIDSEEIYFNMVPLGSDSYLMKILS